MPIYGPIEVQYWQITPMGVQRYQSRKFQSMEAADRMVLRELVELGGIAETDELTVGGGISPATINNSLRKSVDLGLVTPLGPQPETAPQPTV